MNNDSQVIVYNPNVDFTERKSSLNNNIQEVVTVGDLRGYKVFTALLTQNGGDDQVVINWNDPNPILTIGVTYTIQNNSLGLDMTNVGAPNNDNGTSFVATGTTPNSWGKGVVSYIEGAPVATVLENTIGNIWFTIDSDGLYLVYSDNLFTNNKTLVLLGTLTNNSSGHTFVINGAISTSMFDLIVQDSSFVGVNGELANTPIEIRVYN